MRIYQFSKGFFITGLLLLILFPGLPLLFFAPYLAANCYREDLTRLLLNALGCGLLVDLCTNAHHLGLCAIASFGAAFILFTQRRHLFADKFSTLLITTYLFSLLYSFFYLFLSPLFGPKILFHFSWILNEIFIMPLSDSLYGGILLFTFWQLKKRVRRES